MHSALIQVQRDLNNWKLRLVVWVMDRGMSSDENRRILVMFYMGLKMTGVFAWPHLPVSMPNHFSRKVCIGKALMMSGPWSFLADKEG